MNNQEGSFAFLCFAFFIIGVFFTAISLLQNPIFNTDALYYFHTASLFLQRGLIFTLLQHDYKLPFYGIVIGSVSNILHISLLHAAYLLNVTLDILTGLVFLLVIKRLGGSKHVLWLALLVFAIYLPFNNFRSYIVRGHGYWFFYLLSIYWFFVFAEKFDFRAALAWFVSITVASAFRIEGLLFLIMPIFVLFFRQKSLVSRYKGLIYLLTPMLLLVIIALLVLVFHPNALHHAGQISFIDSEFLNGIYRLFYSLGHMRWSLQNSVLYSLVDKTDSSIFIVTGLVFVYLYNAIEIITLGYFILFIFSFLSNLKKEQNKLIILGGYLLINVILTFVYLIQMQGFISSRYLFPMGLTVLCFVPFGLDYLYSRWRASASKMSPISLLFYFVSILMFASFVGSIVHFGPSKRFIANAAQWVRQNTQQSARIYTNHAVFAYMTDRNFGGFDVKENDYFSLQNASKKPWTGYNVAVLILSSKETPQLNAFQKEAAKMPVEIFWDKHHQEAAYIFKLSEQ